MHHVMFERDMADRECGVVLPEAIEHEELQSIKTKIISVFDSEKFTAFMYGIGEDNYQDFSYGSPIEIDDDRMIRNVLCKMVELGLLRELGILASALSVDIGSIIFTVY